MREQTSPARRHPRLALNDRKIKTLKPTGRARRIADGGGLYLVIAPNGSKSWVLRVVVMGKRCDLGLGSAALVGLADAREAALRLRKIARAGGDPVAERRRERRPVLTFRSAAEEVHKSLSASFRNAKHKKQWLDSLGPVVDAFGGKPVDAVTSADVLDALHPFWLVRPETARRVLQRLRTIFEWCKAKEFRSGDNPTQGVAKVLPDQGFSRNHHAALEYELVPAFIQALRAADAAEGVKLALELTVLCATRTSETLYAKWDEFDMAAKTWTIPGTRMKAGRDHRVPLTNRSIEILNRASVLANGSPYVFPGRSAKKPLSNMAFLMMLRRMKRDAITVHGFRSSFRIWVSEQTNTPTAVAEAALAHTVKNLTQAAYDRTDYFDRRRPLMEEWERFATGNVASSSSA